MGRTGLLAIAILGAAVLGTFPLTGSAYHRVARHFGIEAPQRALIPGDAMQAFSVSALDGSAATVRPESGRVRVINIFATWCSQCRLEIPELARLGPQLGSRVQIVGVDQQEAADDVARFASEVGMNYPIYIDNDGVTRRLFGARFIPTTIVVDEKGVVRFVRAGALSADDLKSLIVAARS